MKQRAEDGLPHESTLNTDDFMALTLDIWNIPPKSARRVGHPAPFPVELPAKLIDHYTFKNDLVLDPFMGSGSAMIAASRRGRRYVGDDLDPAYVNLARQRLEESTRAQESQRFASEKLERQRVEESKLAKPEEPVPKNPGAPRIESPGGAGSSDFQSRASKEGKAAQKLAEDLLHEVGFKNSRRTSASPRPA